MLSALQTQREQILKNKIHYENLSNMVPVGIFETEANGSCIYVNDSWIKMTGLTQEEALGYGWVKIIHPDDKKTVLAAIENAVEKNAPFNIDFRIVTPTGETRWITTSARVSFDQNNVTKWGMCVSWICIVKF